jgi:hypothetical protein
MMKVIITKVMAMIKVTIEMIKVMIMITNGGKVMMIIYVGMYYKKVEYLMT